MSRGGADAGRSTDLPREPRRSQRGGRSLGSIAWSVARHAAALALVLAVSALSAAVLFVHVARDDLQWERLGALTAAVAAVAFVASLLASPRWWIGLLAAAGSIAVGLVELAAWLHSGLDIARLAGFAALGLVVHPLLAWAASKKGSDPFSARAARKGKGV